MANELKPGERVYSNKWGFGRVVKVEDGIAWVLFEFQKNPIALSPASNVYKMSDGLLLSVCKEWLGKLCQTGGKAWVLHIPPIPDRDPDFLFMELIRSYEDLLKTVAQLRGESEDPAEISDEKYVKSYFPTAFSKTLEEYGDEYFGVVIGTITFSASAVSEEAAWALAKRRIQMRGVPIDMRGSEEV